MGFLWAKVIDLHGRATTARYRTWMLESHTVFRSAPLKAVLRRAAQILRLARLSADYAANSKALGTVTGLCVHSRRHLINSMRQGRRNVSSQEFGISTPNSSLRSIAKHMIKTESALITVILAMSTSAAPYRSSLS